MTVPRPAKRGEGGRRPGEGSWRIGMLVLSDVSRQRELRQQATDAEIAMWEIVRDRRLRGVKFRRQHRVGPFILDFFSTSLQFAIELDGAEHFTENGIKNDVIRTAFLIERGIHVLRFENNDVLVKLTHISSVFA